MTKLKEIIINGLKYYADLKNKKLYEDKEMNNEITFLPSNKDKKDKSSTDSNEV